LVERNPWDGDQADGLRRLFGSRAPQVVAFASGREACGRTTLVVQTAAALAAAGHGVVVVDETPAPDNTLAAFGLGGGRHDFFNVVRGDRPLAQIAVNAAPLVRIVPAARAAREFDHLDLNGFQRLAAGLRDIQRGASFVLIDSANRRAGRLSAIAASARHVAVVVAAQGQAITHAYALIKRIAQDYGRDHFQIVVTRARSGDEAQAVFDNMRRVAREHIGVRLDYLGAAAVPVTEHLAEALLHRLPAIADAADIGGLVPSSLETGRRPGLVDSVL
jgi:flagellar biosynthesis protein FlhG